MKKAKKINSKTTNKNILFLISIGLLCSLMIIGGSYAILKMTIWSKKNTEVIAGTLSIKYEDGKTINLDNTYPMNDTRGMATPSYQFSVENTGTIKTRYEITLEEANKTNNTLDSSYLRYAIKKNEEEWSKPQNLESLVLDSNIELAVDEKNEYQLKIWLDEKAGNETQGKEFKARIIVNAIQDNENLQDVTPPVIKLKGDLSVNVEENTDYQDLGVASVEDNQDTLNNDEVQITYEYYNNEETTEEDHVDTSKVGVHYIYYRISDKSKNEGLIVRSVNVYHKDTNPPEINLNGESLIAVEKDSEYVDEGAEATDQEEGNLTSRIVTVGTVNTKKVGTYTIKYLITDQSGNTSSIVRVVNVVKTSSNVEDAITLDLSGKKTEQIMITGENLGKLSYQSKSNDIASVNETGLITANKIGTTSIIVTSTTGYKKEITVIVQKTVTVNFKANGNNLDGKAEDMTKTCVIKEKSCRITSPVITSTITTTIIGYSNSQTSRESLWKSGEEKEITDNATYYAQTMKKEELRKVTFKANGNKIDNGTEDIIKSCQIEATYNGVEQKIECDITTPTITPSNNNTPNIIGYNEDSKGTTSQVGSGEKLALTSAITGKTYYAITSSEAISYGVSFKANGNQIDKGSLDISKTCQIAASYNGVAQDTSCTVQTPTIDAPQATPTIIGYSLGETDRVSKVGSNSQLTINNENNEEIYYAQTKMNAKIHTITFNRNGAKTQTNAEDKAVNDATVIRTCTREATYNGVDQATTCNITSPTIVGSDNTPTVIGYSDSAMNHTSGWDHKSQKAVSKDETWYAQTMTPEIKHKITFNPNGNPSFTYNGTRQTVTKEYDLCTREATYNGESQASDCNATITLPTIEAHANTKTLIGWSDSATNHVATYTSGQASQKITTNKNLVYYAQTTANEKKYKATYTKGTGIDRIGENENSCTISATYNGSTQSTTCEITLPSITALTGYTASGWFNNETKKGGANEKIQISSNLDLEARATINNYTITYDYNYQQDNIGNWNYIYPERFKNEYDNTTKMNNLSITTAGGWETAYIPIYTTVNENYTITFDYEVPQAYNGNGGAYQALTEVTNGNNSATSLATKSLSSSVTPKTTVSLSFKATTNITYFALNFGYSADAQTFKLNVGNFKITSSEQKAYKTTFDKIKTPTRPGYVFGGWWTKSDGSGNQLTTATSVPAENVTYYAKWTDNVKPIWELVSTTPTSGEIESTGTLTITFKGTDTSGNVLSTLTRDNITIKLGTTLVNPTTKTLSNSSNVDNGKQYTLTLSGFGDNAGIVSIVIAKDTLSDISNNKNIETTFKTQITIKEPDPNRDPNSLYSIVKAKTTGTDENIDFTTTTITSGVYTKHETTADKYPVYYYRGNVNNNIIFGGFCWKIVRTTGTGGVKLIYNGVPNSGSCNCTKNNCAITTGVFNSNASSEKYVGYMYDENTNSSIKTTIDNWYKENLITQSSRLEDTIWCNDRSTTSTSTTTINYGSRERNLTSPYTPSLNCTQKEDNYAVLDGNAQLSYPIGLLTADEASLAGSGYVSYSSTSYLNTNGNWWLLSPNRFASSSANVFRITTTGALTGGAVSGTNGIRPVISLIKGTKITTTGDGTTNTPYNVEEQELKDTTKPEWKISKMNVEGGKIPANGNLIVTIKGADIVGSVTSTLTANDIEIKVNNNVVNLETKELSTAKNIENGIEYTLTLYGFEENYGAVVSATIAENTLTDSANNKNVKTTLTLGSIESDPKELYNIMKQESLGSDENIDFYDYNTKIVSGVYMAKETENDPYPVYYYRGNAKNRVKFAGKYWYIVRTTETGGVKLILDGSIGDSKFNSSDKSLAYVGYMYGDVYQETVSDLRGTTLSDKLIYGNDVEWDGSKYTLKDTYKSGNWADSYQIVGRNYHYTCNSTTATSCSQVYYIRSISSNNQGMYLKLTNGEKIEDALEKMMENKNDSTIKTVVDDWYEKNLLEYTDQLEDAVFCNDRSFYKKGGFDKDLSSTPIFSSEYRNDYGIYRPSLRCANRNDRFTVSNANGNGALKYPIGLLTADEATLAGGREDFYTHSNSSYLHTGSNYWTMSPGDIWDNYLSYGANLYYHNFFIQHENYSEETSVTTSMKVKPVISLPPRTRVISGDGSNPYEIDTTVQVKDRLKPTWELVSTTLKSGLTNKNDTIEVTFMGIDNRKKVESKLTVDKIKIRINGQEISPNKKLSTVNQVGDQLQYTLTISNITQLGVLSIEIDENTLVDLSNNININTLITLGSIVEEVNKGDQTILYNRIKSQTKGEEKMLDYPTDDIKPGVYTKRETINDKYPVYFYRGKLNNNNLIFANICWKIVRTTDTGGVKLIYNGTPENGTCTGTNIDSLGETRFNEKYNSIEYSMAYLGYMYGDVYENSSSASETSNYIYGNDVKWDGSKYTLIDTYKGSTKYNYETIREKYHYSCRSTGTTCQNVYYYYSIDENYLRYIILNSGVNIEEALNNMFKNENDSSVKKVIDAWYKTNIDDKGYTGKLEDTIWCNDRSYNENSGLQKDNNAAVSLEFSAYNRNKREAYNKSSFDCREKRDSFTVTETEKGNGALTYPVGLLTADEVTLAGSGELSSYNEYLAGGGTWLMSPYSYSSLAMLNSTNSSSTNPTYSEYVRPAISLKEGTKIASGSGLSTDPYIIN